MPKCQWSLTVSIKKAKTNLSNIKVFMCDIYFPSILSNAPITQLSHIYIINSNSFCTRVKEAFWCKYHHFKWQSNMWSFFTFLKISCKLLNQCSLSLVKCKAMPSRDAEEFGRVTKTYDLKLQKDFSLKVHEDWTGKTKHLTQEIRKSQFVQTLTRRNLYALEQATHLCLCTHSMPGTFLIFPQWHI